MIKNAGRCFTAVMAWLSAISIFVLQDEHYAQTVALLSIVLAMLAVVPNKELLAKGTSRTLWTADFLAGAYFMTLAILGSAGLLYGLLKLSGVIA